MQARSLWSSKARAQLPVAIARQFLPYTHCQRSATAEAMSRPVDVRREKISRIFRTILAGSLSSYLFHEHGRANAKTGTLSGQRRWADLPRSRSLQPTTRRTHRSEPRRLLPSRQPERIISPPECRTSCCSCLSPFPVSLSLPLSLSARCWRCMSTRRL